MSNYVEENYSDGSDYWNVIVDLLRTLPVERILEHTEVNKRCCKVFYDHDSFQQQLLQSTVMDGLVSITDFRMLSTITDGNRFLVYCLFPDCITNVKISNGSESDSSIRCSVGHNIFKRESKVSAGELLKRYNGGGHFGAGGASLPIDQCDEQITTIIEILNRNTPLTK